MGKAAENRPLNDRQKNAVAYLASGMTAVQTAKKLKVTEESIRIWKKLPLFSEALDRAHREFAEAALYRLHSMADETVDLTMGIVRDECENGQTRLSGIKMIWDRILPTKQADPKQVTNNNLRVTMNSLSYNQMEKFLEENGAIETTILAIPEKK